jgi:hypothetical protein
MMGVKLKVLTSKAEPQMLAIGILKEGDLAKELKGLKILK